MLIKGILFDFDGTLTEPDSLDFSAIRTAIGCPPGRPILEYIESIASISEQTTAREILHRFETEAACCSRPNAGVEDLVRFIRSRRLKTGIVTRNSMASVRRALENFRDIGESDFDVVLSRDDAFAPKPSPDALLEAVRRLGLLPQEALVVGDFVFDIEAGRRAGALTVLITNGRTPVDCEPAPDFTIHSMRELRGIINDVTPLPDGKLPNDLLYRFLGELDPGGGALLIAPGIGEDVAAVRLAGEEVLVLKSDPVTFATDRIGHYAVTVNVNDVATSGAVPRWLLATLLFPPGTRAPDVRRVMQEIAAVARQHGLLLCGGHTEITDAVTRPVAAVQVAGTVRAGGLIDKRRMKNGDVVLLTKGIAVEGTSLIAREFPSWLLEKGVPASEIDSWRELLVNPGISIAREAAIASSFGMVSAMHDVTEGGLATALEELSAAGRHRIRVCPERIPVLDQTAKLCRLLDINPLGLIGSGSLLIVCAPEACGALAEAVRSAGIDATRIGEVLGPGSGVEAAGTGAEDGWPHFEVDELARVFRQLGGQECE